MADGAQPIIVIKKRKTHHAHHGGAWKVAYADFVTAMMALFIVLWLLSSNEKVKKAVGGYFLDPKGVGREMGSNLAGVGDSLSISKEDMNKLKEKIESAIKTMPELRKMRDQVEITVTGEGLRIELLENENGTFFESGSPKPSGTCLQLLTRMAQELSKFPNTVVVEGHTDARPYASTDGYTNWDLSTERANAGRRVMMAGGLRPDRVVQVRGFADHKLRNPKDPADPANRRISVIVQYLDPPATGGKQQVGQPAAHEAPAAKPGAGASPK